MGIDKSGLAFGTGPTRRKRINAVRRQAAKVVKSVRAQCVERDGYCRLAQWPSSDRLFSGLTNTCVGPSEWAHLGEHKRFKTRGQPATRRHTTAGSLMLCTRHHRDYDAGWMEIRGDDANGVLDFRYGTTWRRIT